MTDMQETLAKMVGKRLKREATQQDLNKELMELRLQLGYINTDIDKLVKNRKQIEDQIEKIEKELNKLKIPF